MLHNNPWGSRRRRRFYHRMHRAGVVPIPGEKLHEFYEVPIGFFSDFPETDLETINEKPKTKIVSVDILMCRLIDIINQMIDLDEAETRRKEEEARAKAKAKARKADLKAKAGPSNAQAVAGPSHAADTDQAAGVDGAEADATKALAKDSKDSSEAKVEETAKANEAVADAAGTQPKAEAE